ncbi:tetratricopeptide repeat protein [Synechocystis salina]|uniref:protein O-GlcNAc transferase n=1 Tax=Synechocystis salina LEGE 00031 TaxID=1828736 RepID=A0ABR9VT65_9SYNC|nr:tetratricopeptide repeat protein [Synechocystis salina]MBE9241093.1 tetratricopeptide repeat protein [Synechocystis salina LEGE 00041]MBE9254555.1 tetratricopeptide repeat protein [Synechocystis salina LEGE 00031]
MSEYLTQVVELIDRANFDEALKILENLNWNKSTNSCAYQYLGLVYVLIGEVRAAEEVFLSYLLSLESTQAESALKDLVYFLQTNLTQELKLNRLGNAKLIYEVIVELDPGYENSGMREKLVEAITFYASSLSFSKDYADAVAIYEQALQLDSNHGDTLHSLALTYYHLKNYQEAEAIITRAITIDETRVDNYLLLAINLEQQRRWQDTINVCYQALNYDSKNLTIYEILGRSYSKLRQWNKSLNVYQQSLSQYPKNTFFLQKMSDTYSELGDLKNQLLYQGYADYSSGNTGSLWLALKSFHKYLRLTDGSEINDFYFYGCLANCYAMCNQTKSAIDCLDVALNLFPHNRLEIKRLHQSVLPVLYSDTQEVELYHQRFKLLLDELIKEKILKTQTGIDDFIKSISKKSNFYLAYQYKNDLETYRVYGNYINENFQKMRPSSCKPIIPKALSKKRKIRIGLISQRLEGLGRLYLGWIKYLDRKKYQTYIYSVCEQNEDSIVGLKVDFQKFSFQYKSIYYSMGWDEVCQVILDDQIDVLIFPDFGIDPILNLLAYLRLAPVQCTTWGHPVTSGSPTIDYFLSSDLMEPENGDKHYSETLVRLPNLAFSLPPVELPSLDKTRSDWQLGKDKVIYLCSQSMYKYLPQHDWLFAAIAAESEMFQFVFVDPIHGEVIRNCFAQRLNQTFTKYGLDYRDYCVFLPRLSNSDFLKVNQLADIFLDCLSWSGGLTTHQAISCNLPVVTCPGKFMRARHSYGMLKMIDVTETIAQSPEEYIEIAVRLGADSHWRQQIRDLMEKNKNKLFDDQECIKGLEQFLYNAVISRAV